MDRFQLCSEVVALAMIVLWEERERESFEHSLAELQQREEGESKCITYPISRDFKFHRCIFIQLPTFFPNNVKSYSLVIKCEEVVGELE